MHFTGRLLKPPGIYSQISKESRLADVIKRLYVAPVHLHLAAVIASGLVMPVDNVLNVLRAIYNVLIHERFISGSVFSVNMRRV
jgi:hypothetical protein